jgi:acyl dehydratase
MAQPKVLFDDIEVGYQIPPLVKDPITETQLVMYAGASGDFNPIHTVHAFGEKAGFGGVIGHGMLSMGFAGQFMTNWVGVKALKKLAVQFRAVTKPKDVITVSGTVIKKYTKDGQKLVDCELLATNQKGDKIIIGTATAELS